MRNAYTCMFPCNQKETVDNTEMHLHKYCWSYGLQPKTKSILNTTGTVH